MWYPWTWSIGTYGQGSNVAYVGRVGGVRLPIGVSVNLELLGNGSVRPKKAVHISPMDQVHSFPETVSVDKVHSYTGIGISGPGL